MKRFLILCVALMLAVMPSLAEGVTFEGSVVSTASTALLAPAAGTVSEILVHAGSRVSAGDEVAALFASTVYATEAGTVKLYGQPGDAIDTLTGRYGAVLYIEPDVKYTISVSTRNAYDSIETRIIHPGETVYLCSNNSSYGNEGIGVVTSVNGSSYTVEVSEGTFRDGEQVNVYRDSSYAAATRIGRGNAAYNGAIAYSGSGAVTDVYVADGAHVEAGTALYAALETTAYNHCLAARADGIVASLNVSAGDAVEQYALVATIYPDSAMRLEILADEADLRSITLGSSVVIKFANGVETTGVVESIGGIQYVAEPTDEEDDTADDDAYFSVYVAFTPDSSIAYGMTAKVTLPEDAAE